MILFHKVRKNLQSSLLKQRNENKIACLAILSNLNTYRLLFYINIASACDTLIKSSFIQ